jgi:hypothetical protein
MVACIVLVRISRREKARHFLPFLRARFVIRLILGTKRCHFLRYLRVCFAVLSLALGHFLLVILVVVLEAC